MTPLVVSPDGLVWCTNFNSHNMEEALIWFDGEQFGTITRDQGLPHAQIYDAEVREIPGAYEIWLACASRGIAVLTVPFNVPSDAAPGLVSDDALRLSPAYPNPFHGFTRVAYNLDTAGYARLTVFDSNGRVVRILDEGLRNPGAHAVEWDGRDRLGRSLGSGVFFYRLETPQGSVQRRMTLIR